MTRAAGDDWCAVFKDRFREVAAALERHYSTLDVDPILAEVADRVEADGLEAEVRCAITWVINSGEFTAVAEVVQFFGYRFRWAWLRRDVEGILEAKRRERDLRAIPYFEWVLEAFGDGWEDRDFFPSLLAVGSAEDS
ncbi:hypothetical protein [Kutzneria sp. NPDC052558]|uniref:hypothetical protein n=1 Tax=Kutzneria sp. NPDC052558 TaxID=3364121 RepID=UPI0037CB31BD